MLRAEQFYCDEQRMFMYVCMYVCMCVCIMYVRTYVCMHVCVYVLLCMYVFCYHSSISSPDGGLTLTYKLLLDVVVWSHILFRGCRVTSHLVGTLDKRRLLLLSSGCLSACTYKDSSCTCCSFNTHQCFCYVFFCVPQSTKQQSYLNLQSSSSGAL